MLDQNWKFITLKSYTAWAFYALAAITLAPDVIYWTAGVDTNPAVWSLLQLWTVALGVSGRLIMQTQAGAIKRRFILAGIVLATLFAAGQSLAQTTERQTMPVLVPLVIKWEGEHRCRDDRSMHCAYRDIVGVPTLCFGETKGVKMGDRATDRDCRTMLEHRLKKDYRAGLHKYFTEETKRFRLTPERDAAFVSLAYNVGVRGAGRSTATRRLNAGDIAGGCKALTWWDKAGGYRRKGLSNRRHDEYLLCMKTVL